MLFAPYLSLSLLGVAILWSVRLLQSPRQLPSDSKTVLAINMLAWQLILIGAIFSGFVVAAVVVLILAAAIVFQYRTNEYRALMWTIATAARRQLPLDLAVESFAQGRTDEVGRRAARLHDLLHAGVALPDALKQAKIRLPLSLAVATQIGCATDTLSDTVADSLHQLDEQAETHYRSVEKTIYIFGLLIMSIGVFLFLTIKIQPTYEQILQDLDVQVTGLPDYCMQVMKTMTRSCWFLAIPLALCIAFFLKWNLLIYVGVPVPQPAISAWLFGRWEKSTLLRSLAIQCRQGRTVVQSLELLRLKYPRYAIKAKLSTALQQVQQGLHWCDALVSVKLLTSSDRQILMSAERIQNLPWCLDELAEAHCHRIDYRMQLAQRTLFPVLLLLLAIPIAVAAIAFTAPLFVVVESLAK